MSKNSKNSKNKVSAIVTGGAMMCSENITGVTPAEIAEAQELSTIEAMLQQEATVANTAIAATVAVKTVSAARARYMDIANVHPLNRIQHDGSNYAPKNKGALMAALWYAVCAACGYTNTGKANATLLTLCAKLGAHAVTHCASKGKALAGAEVSDNGAVGYARALKGALTGATDQHSTRFAQYLIGGKRHDAATIETNLASLLVTLYGSVEGIDACKRAVGTVSV